MNQPKQSKAINNKTNGTVADELRENIYAHSKLSIISAYFTIYAYQNLKHELNKIDELRFIFSEPFLNSDPDHPDKEFREYEIHRDGDAALTGAPINRYPTVAGSDYEIRLRNEMRQAAIARECADWVREKAVFRAYNQPNLAQLRHITISGREDVSISGSMDFSAEGLGIVPSDRFDWVTINYGREHAEAFLKQFDEIWNDPTRVHDVTEAVLNDMETLYKENSPQSIYFMILYHIFYDYLDELTEDRIMKTGTGIKESQIWNKLYDFQKDGVMGALEKIERYNGCILADSVGLGKTFSALAIIRYYELRNDRVLVLCPKKLYDNWVIYTQNDRRNPLINDRFNYDVLYHTDLSRTGGYSNALNLSTINWGNYDLVVIDESHNFRNNNPVKGKVTRYQRLMRDIIQSGVKTKVLMLSATPVNNRMNDLKNQVMIMTEGNDQALKRFGLPSIENVLRKAQIKYNQWQELRDEERTTERFVGMMDLDYFRLLDMLTIARSRKHIERYYSTSEIGEFPERLKPINLYSAIDTEAEFPPIADVNRQIQRLTMALYNPLAYVRVNQRKKYADRYDIDTESGGIFTQLDRDKHLIGLMRVNILKRLESSVHAFRLTIERMLNRIHGMLDQIQNYDSEIDVEQDFDDFDFDDADLADTWVGGKIKVLLQDMDLLKWEQDLSYDADNMQTLLEAATHVTAERDLKLSDLRRQIRQKMEHPINPGNRKVIVFTAFADTAEYLYSRLSPPLAQQGIYTALVTGSGANQSTLPVPASLRNTVRLSDLNTLLTLFSPRSKECANIFPEMTEFIDVLIATDCISEGQNLQDCDYLVNYDIHWNPVRIIQRFGRIDRIGSVNKRIQLINFWPMQDLDAYINLEQRVRGRMVMSNVAATGEENLLEHSNREEMNDLAYRRKQLEQLQNEVLDLEEISGGISITDLNFSDFRVDLIGALKDQRKILAALPTGIYALTGIPNQPDQDLEPGVIFVLKQRKGARISTEQNPIFPYYLIYITRAGEVKYNFSHAKQILDLLRKLCLGNNDVDVNLVSRFNRVTADGTNMDAHSALLRQSIESIIGSKTEAGLATLFSPGGTAFEASELNELEDYHLVAFLQLMEGGHD